MKFFRDIISKEVPFFLACPAFLWQGIFLYLPIFLLVVHSLVDVSPDTGRWFLTLKFYEQIFRSAYIKVILNSFLLALVTASISLAVAYPVAYLIALKSSKRFRMYLLFTLILPSWTSLVVQAYAWFFLLDRNGFLAKILRTLHIIGPDQTLINNYASILIGMVSVYLPFMILPIFSIIEKMDKTILEASADLGATRFQTFRRVVLPLSMPGVYVGFLLVFVPAFGEFAIPALLGGSKIVSWGTLIVEKFLIAKDWKSGAAFASFGIFFPVLVLIAVYCIVRIFQGTRPNKIAAEPVQKDVW